MSERSFEERMKAAKQRERMASGHYGFFYVDYQCAENIAREADAEIARLQPRKIAPVQGYYPGIPWDMHLRAYTAYCKRWGPQKALIEGNCRGGFGTKELDEFIPGWMDELSDRTRLTALAQAQKELIDHYGALLDKSESFLRAHNWHYTNEEIAKGGELRDKIRRVSDEQ